MIKLQCLFSLLEREITILYIDSMSIGLVIYYFPSNYPPLTFSGECVPQDVVENVLQEFKLTHFRSELLRQSCRCA